MGTRRLAAEWSARLILIALVLGLPMLALSSRWLQRDQVIELRAALPEAGGWLPGNLEAQVGQPLHLSLTSTDVVHGIAIGRTDHPAVDIYPGETQELVLTFEQPGTYTYYCTRWCGVNHWRMRGTIEVSGPGERLGDSKIPLYLELGIDLDSPREIQTVLDQKPSAVGGAELSHLVVAQEFGWDTYVKNSPYEIWQQLQEDPGTKDLDPLEIWDLVAWIWQENSAPEGLENGRQLYSQNCSACHGETGQGDGVMKAKLLESGAGFDSHGDSEYGHETRAPSDFTDRQSMLAASPALLQGKILRGGMGTGMPSWGLIFTEEETWNLVAYLWTFQFDQDSSSNVR